VLTFVGSRKLELLVFALGVLLRASMRFSYNPRWAYDFPWHWEVVEWIKLHHAVPPVEAVFQAQHPPLFYAIAAFFSSRGVSLESLAWLPITCGILRLAVVWAGFEIFLPGSRTARVSGLALAAVLGASVHVDGMVYPEAMSCLLNTVGVLLAALAFRRRGNGRWIFALAVGLVLGFAMLTKVSAVSTLAAIGSVAAIELVFAEAEPGERIRNLACWVGSMAMCLTVCGWYYARNVRDYGRPFVTSFDLPSQHYLIQAMDDVPYLERRPLGFFLRWESAIYDFPYHPSATGTHPTFFPAVVASSFVDYWNYGFSNVSPLAPSGFVHPAQAVPPPVMTASRRAALGGTVIFAATVAAWLGSVRRVFIRRDFGLLFLFAVPVVAVLSALHFAIAYPVDDFGVVKGVYLQFAAPVMCALFGVAVAWSQRKVPRWPVFGLLMAALWLVAAYTLYCRFRLPLLPTG
jgi:hypothetical protein